MARPRPGNRLRIPTAAYMVLLAASLGALAALFASDIDAQRRADSAIAEHERIRAGNAAAAETALEQARMYNAKLAGRAPAADVLPYEDQLSVDGDPMMAYIEIPAISLRAPVYHGTRSGALMAGVGHLESSSLPVGGEGSHCVLLGHSGMRDAHMFDELWRMKAGDEIVLWTMGEPFAYRVGKSEVLTPEEAEMAYRTSGDGDELTLVTCVPYGINTHRLLVSASRCGYDGVRPDMSAGINSRNGPLAAAAVAITLFAVAHARSASAKKRRPKMKGESGYGTER